MTGTRIAIVVSAVLAAGFLFLVLRDEGDDGGQPATKPAAEKPTGGDGQSDGQARKPKPEDTAVEVQVEEGRPVGRVHEIEVDAGAPVRIEVSSSDTTEEVHVHGYDVTADLAPGKPAKLAFDATIEGVFEIELERSAVPIAELTVSP